MQKRTARHNGKIILLVCAITLLFFVLYQSVWKKPTLISHGMVQLESVFQKHTAPLGAVRFSPDGNLLASGGVDSTVKIWRRNDQSVVHNLKQPAGITALEFSPDGHMLLTAGYDSSLRIWNWTADTIWTVAFSPDGKTIASGGEDRTVRLWNTADGALVKTIPAHALNIWKVRFTPDGKNIISSSFDNTIKIWNAADGSLLKTLKGHTEAVVGLAVSPDGRLLASGSDDKTVRIWELHSGKLLRTLQNGDGHVYAVAFSPDGKKLISGSRDKDNLGEIVQNFFGNNTAKGISMRLWDVQSGELLETLAEHSNDVVDVCYSSDGKWIASASDDKTVRLWKTTK